MLASVDGIVVIDGITNCSKPFKGQNHGEVSRGTHDHVVKLVEEVSK